MFRIATNTNSTPKPNQPMKRSILALVFASLVLGPLTSAEAAVETYDIDPVHTWVGFTISHFFTKVPGYFGKLKGTIVVDRDHLENSSTAAVIEVASITTNTRMRDDDLRSTNFFAAAKFPAMTFKSKAWKSTGGETYDVTGVLTMKSVAKEVVLKVTSLGFGPGMKGGREFRLGSLGHAGSTRFRHRGGPRHDRQQRGCRHSC